VRWRVEHAKWCGQFMPDEDQVPDRARGEIRAAEGGAPGDRVRAEVEVAGGRTTGDGVRAEVEVAECRARGTRHRITPTPAAGVANGGSREGCGGSGLVNGQTGRSGGVVAVAGIDDLEVLGGGVEAGESNQGDSDAGTPLAVLIDVTAVRATPDVDLTDVDRRPMAQLARREAEILVANMRVDRAARARYAAGASMRSFHGKTLCRGMAVVKENSLIEIRPVGRERPAGCGPRPLNMVMYARNGLPIPIVGQARYACVVGGAGGSGNFTHRL
jgi:hypothetical protein